MAVTDPVTVARWVITAGWDSRDRVKATAVALASGADPDRPGGLFGVGTTGDGQAQARQALGVFRDKGWSGFPASRNGGDVLMIPIALPAVAAALAAGAAVQLPAEVAGAAQAATSPIQAAGDLASQAGAWLDYLTTENAWKRATKFVIGVGMIMVSVASFTTGMVIKPAVSTVTDAAGTILAGRVVKDTAKGATEAVRRSRYRGRHTADGAPIRDSSATEVVDNKK